MWAPMSRKTGSIELLAADDMIAFNRNQRYYETESLEEHGIQYYLMTQYGENEIKLVIAPDFLGYTMWVVCPYQAVVCMAVERVIGLSGDYMRSCSACNGTGNCPKCGGKGYNESRHCWNCKGSDECQACSGKGQCPDCYGKGQK